jgi:hypothetical protein
MRGVESPYPLPISYAARAAPGYFRAGSGGDVFVGFVDEWLQPDRSCGHVHAPQFLAVVEPFAAADRGGSPAREGGAYVGSSTPSGQS